MADEQHRPTPDRSPAGPPRQYRRTLAALPAQLVACCIGLPVTVWAAAGGVVLPVVAGVLALAGVAILESNQYWVVRANRAGLVLESPCRLRTVPWHRVRTHADETSVFDRWPIGILVLTDGRRIRLPVGIPAGTVERWRTEVGGEPAEPSRHDTP